MKRRSDANVVQQDLPSKGRLDGEAVPGGEDARVEITLPVPSDLIVTEQVLPKEIVDILQALRTHRATKLSELAEYLSDTVCSAGGDEGRVTFTGYEERVYDEYFLVSRTASQPLLHLALAFLKTLRDCALNASLGVDLEPAALADFLRSIRNDAEVILEVTKS